MPPVVADYIADKHSHLLGRDEVAERDSILTWFGTIGGFIIEVASMTPYTHPFISGVVAGILATATEASHARADKVDAPFRGEQAVPRFHENPAVNQGEAVRIGEVIENITRLGIVDAAHDEVRIGCEPVGPLRTDGQGHRTYDGTARCGNSAKMRSCHVRFGQAEAMPVGVDQAIQVSVLDQVGVDHGDLLKSGARQGFEDDRTDAARSDDADMSASQTRLCIYAPAIDGAHQAWTASVGRVRVQGPIHKGTTRPYPTDVRAVGGHDAASSRFLPEPGAPDTVAAHRQAEQRQACLPNEGGDDVAFGIVIHVAQGLPAGTRMAVKDGDTRLCLEGTVQDTVEISALHGDVAVQIPVVIVRQDNVREYPCIAVESVAAAPQRETSLFLQPATAQPAQEVIRELVVERFSQYDAMFQRAPQILRMCLFR